MGMGNLYNLLCELAFNLKCTVEGVAQKSFSSVKKDVEACTDCVAICYTPMLCGAWETSVRR